MINDDSFKNTVNSDYSVFWFIYYFSIIISSVTSFNPALGYLILQGVGEAKGQW